MTSADVQEQPDQSAAWEQTREAALKAFKDGEPERAEALLLQAVQSAESPDSDPIWLIKALQALAHLYGRLRQHDKIEATLTRLLAVQEATLGDHHPDLTGTLQGLAWTIGGCGQAERSEALYRRALAIDEAAFGPNHPHVATSLRVLGVRLFFSKRYEESVEALERARAIVEAEVAAGPTREALSELDTVLGCLELPYTRWERFAQAEQVLLRHIQVAEQRGDDELMVGRLFEKLGSALQGQGKHEEADAAYQTAMLKNHRWFESNRRAKRFRGGPPSRWSTSSLRAGGHHIRGRLLHQRSIVLSGLGREDEAKKCLIQAERALRLAWSLEEPHGRTRGLTGHGLAMGLAAVLRARGKTDKADRLEAQAEADAQAAMADRPSHS